jgi:heme exporter protein D
MKLVICCSHVVESWFSSYSELHCIGFYGEYMMYHLPIQYRCKVSNTVSTVVTTMSYGITIVYMKLVICCSHVVESWFSSYSELHCIGFYGEYVMYHLPIQYRCKVSNAVSTVVTTMSYGITIVYMKLVICCSHVVESWFSSYSELHCIGFYGEYVMYHLPIQYRCKVSNAVSTVVTTMSYGITIVYMKLVICCSHVVESWFSSYSELHCIGFYGEYVMYHLPIQYRCKVSNAVSTVVTTMSYGITIVYM